MRIKYDIETDTLSIKLKNDSIVDSEYLENKGIVLDYNNKDDIVGIEIMGWSKFEKSGQELSLENTG